MKDPPSTTLRVKMDFHRFSSSFQEASHHLICCSKHLNQNITFESLSIFQNIQSLCCSPHHVQLFTCSIAPSNILEPCKGSCGMATMINPTKAWRLDIMRKTSLCFKKTQGITNTKANLNYNIIYITQPLPTLLVNLSISKYHSNQTHQTQHLKPRNQSQNEPTTASSRLKQHL